MPGWHAATKKWVNEGQLTVIAIGQEQHADRLRLFAQWKKLDMPLLIDPINRLGCKGVPIIVAIDESGIVRAVGPKMETLEQDFVAKRFPQPASTATKPAEVAVPELKQLEQSAKKADTAQSWREYGDALVLWKGVDRIDDAISAYERAVQLDARDGNSLFRLGVCYRMRHESKAGKEGDAAKASELWKLARALDEGQYVWRRRSEQYGPKSDRPYPFYDWLDDAAAEIRSRGEKPQAISVPADRDAPP